MHVNLLVWISVVLSCHHAGCTHKSTSRHQLVSELFAVGGLVVGAVDVMHMLSQHVLSSAAAFFWGGGGWPVWCQWTPANWTGAVWMRKLMSAQGLDWSEGQCQAVQMCASLLCLMGSCILCPKAGSVGLGCLMLSICMATWHCYQMRGDRDLTLLLLRDCVSGMRYAVHGPMPKIWTGHELPKQSLTMAVLSRSSLNVGPSTTTTLCKM
jgi:hypothetical protein